MNTRVTEIENKMLSITVLINTVTLNKKVREIKNKIPDITNLATKAALNTKAPQTKNKKVILAVLLLLLNLID